MKKYHLFLSLLGILLLVSGGCSKRKEPKPLITEAPAVETEIGGYITETEKDHDQIHTAEESRKQGLQRY